MLRRRYFGIFIDVLVDPIAWIGPRGVPTTLFYLLAGDMTHSLAHILDRDIFSAP